MRIDRFRDPVLIGAVLATLAARGSPGGKLERCRELVGGARRTDAVRVSAAVRARSERACRDGVALWALARAGDTAQSMAFAQGVAPEQLRRSVVLLCSRKPRLPDGTAAWLRTLVWLARRRDAAGPLLASLGTLPYEVAGYASLTRSCGPPPVLVLEEGTPALLDGAARGRLERRVAGWPDWRRAGFLAPLACLAQGRARRAGERDRFMMNTAGCLVVVAVRADSSLLGPIRARLAHTPAAVLAVAPRRVSGAGIDAGGNRALLAQGTGLFDAGPPACPDDASPAICRWAADHPPAGPVLAHHCADQDGPWPGESRGAFLAALCAGGPPSRRDAFQTLLRIAREGRIRRGQGGLRQPRDKAADKVSAVCLTALRPQPEHPLHRFDSARHRWLFGPYAVCLERVRAEGLGARPVLRLARDAFEQLPPEQRFRYQLHQPPQVDRSVEQEWRVAQDVDLRAFAPQHVWFVTRTEAEAAQVAAAGPWQAWPVARLGG